MRGHIFPKDILCVRARVCVLRRTRKTNVNDGGILEEKSNRCDWLGLNPRPLLVYHPCDTRLTEPFICTVHGLVHDEGGMEEILSPKWPIDRRQT